MVKLLSITHSVGVFAQDKWQINSHVTLSLGLRYDVHMSPLREDWNPFFSDRDTYPVDRNNFQPRVGFAYSPNPSSVVRGGFGIFYEKQWIDRFENYSLNPVFTSSFMAQFPTVQPDPGPGRGQLPTDPLLVNGPDPQPNPRQSAGAVGHAGTQHRRRVARYAGSDSSWAASGLDWLRAANRPAALGSRPTTCTSRTETCRFATI